MSDLLKPTLPNGIGGIMLFTEDAGTVIEGPDGQKETVEEDNAVFVGRDRCHVTHRNYERIKQEIDGAG